MKLGIGSFAYAWSIGVPGYPPTTPMDVFSFLETAFEAGAEVVQIADNLSLHQLSPANRRQLSQRCNSLNLPVEIGTRGLYHDKLVEYLDIADQFNSPFLRLVIDDQGFAPSESRIISDIQKLVPILKAKNIKLAIENHDRFKARQLKQIVEKTDPEWVAVCLDTANSLGAGEGMAEAMDQLAAYTINLHIKDVLIERVSSNMGFTVKGCPAGQGIIDVHGLLERLSQNETFYSTTLEVWSDFEEDLPHTIAREHHWVTQSISFLKPIVLSFR